MPFSASWRIRRKTPRNILFVALPLSQRITQLSRGWQDFSWKRALLSQGWHDLPSKIALLYRDWHDFLRKMMVLSRDLRDLSGRWWSFARLLELLVEGIASFARLLVYLADDDGLFTRSSGFPAKNLGVHDTRYSFHGTFTIAHKGLRFFHENLWQSVLFSFFRGNLVVFWKFCCELSFILVDLTPFSVDLFTCFLGDRVLASKGFVKSLACSQDLSRYPGTLPGIGRLLLQLFPSFDKNCDFPVFEGFLSDFTL